MAVIGGFSRDDPEYLKQLEDEFCTLKKTVAALEAERDADKDVKTEPEDDLSLKMSQVMDSLGELTNRMKKLETGPPLHAPGPGHGVAGSSPASMLTAPLTKALAKLAGEEDDRGKARAPKHMLNMIRKRGIEIIISSIL